MDDFQRVKHTYTKDHINYFVFYVDYDKRTAVLRGYGPEGSFLVPIHLDQLGDEYQATYEL